MRWREIAQPVQPSLVAEATGRHPNNGRRVIGEVARHSGVSTRMLRHYDSVGLVRPTGRTVGGYREYSAEDIRRIFHVESLRSLGLSLRQIGRALEDPALTPSALVGDLIRWAEDRLERAAMPPITSDSQCPPSTIVALAGSASSAAISATIGPVIISLSNDPARSHPSTSSRSEHRPAGVRRSPDR